MLSPPMESNLDRGPRMPESPSDSGGSDCSAMSDPSAALPESVAERVHELKTLIEKDVADLASGKSGLEGEPHHALGEWVHGECSNVEILKEIHEDLLKNGCASPLSPHLPLLKARLISKFSIFRRFLFSLLFIMALLFLLYGLSRLIDFPFMLLLVQIKSMILGKGIHFVLHRIGCSGGVALLVSCACKALLEGLAGDWTTILGNGVLPGEAAPNQGQPAAAAEVGGGKSTISAGGGTRSYARRADFTPSC